MATRKTKTPRWLSIFRKLYNYIGNTGLLIEYFAGNISDHNMVKIMIIYNMIAFTIQTICDAYFFKDDSIDTYKLDPKDANR